MSSSKSLTTTSHRWSDLRPPICAICHARFGSDQGGLVHFAFDDASRAFAERRHSQPGFVGHPPEQEWFCADHVDAARAVAHLTHGEALAKLRSSSSPK